MAADYEITIFAFSLTESHFLFSNFVEPRFSPSAKHNVSLTTISNIKTLFWLAVIQTAGRQGENRVGQQDPNEKLPENCCVMENANLYFLKKKISSGQRKQTLLYCAE